MDLAPRYRLQFGRACPEDKAKPRFSLVAALLELRRQLAENPPVDVFMSRGETTGRFDRLEN